jgi:hypothetical protein
MDRDTRQRGRDALHTVTPYLSFVALVVTAGLIEVYTLSAAGWPFPALVPVYWFTNWFATLMFRNWLAGRKELGHAGHAAQSQLGHR